ncbi:heterokaryon incompatibility protein-domain-containing protein [Pyrenochaeta sp. MPI-SDFR-AT-0127]|nr:heterokaryon incompatibility protein-domain-containing protein [Pyrenochaeta sp. MPI-SDFR-AT-0127]
MNLCSICEAIPWRTLRSDGGNERKFSDGFSQLEAAAGDNLLWCNGSGRSVKMDQNPWPFIRHRSSSSQVQEGAKACCFCDLVVRAVRDPSVQPTYHGGFKLKKKNFYGEAWDNKAVWTQLPHNEDAFRDVETRPLCRLWIGDSRPEHFIRAIEPQTTFDSPLSHMFPQVVLENPFHSTVQKQIRSWLDRCNTDHALCLEHANRAPLLPTRILDLDALLTADDIIAHGDSWGEQFQSGNIKLVETLTGQAAHYMALSYCWGSSLPYKTTKESLQVHMNGIKIKALPKTLQESMLVARVFGIRYIWIDCLCIVQDDKEDWERESARMADIYSQSYLALAATRAKHCEQGILGLRTNPPGTAILFHDAQGEYELYFQQRPRGLGDSEDFINQLEPLQRRAWVFQERILAPRTLHFGSDQLYWECPDGLISEDGYGSFDPRDTSFEHSLEHIAKELVDADYRRFSSTKWARLVSSYTALDITYPSDRLPALSGILATLQDMTGDSCYGGLWKRHFLNGLLWYAEKPKKLDSYRAPSWSFTALDGNISYFVDLRWADEVTKHIARIEECSVTPLGHNPLGELKSGFARITAPLTSIEPLPPYPTCAEYWNRMIRMGDGQMREAMARFDFEQQDYADVLMVTTNMGLLIQQVSPGRDEWVRIGIVEVFEDDGIEDDDVETESSKFESSLSESSYPPTRTITLL